MEGQTGDVSECNRRNDKYRDESIVEDKQLEIVEQDKRGQVEQAASVPWNGLWIPSRRRFPNSVPLLFKIPRKRKTKIRRRSSHAPQQCFSLLFDPDHNKGI
eukprot:scaffold1190_cov187-Ochromonas_danica.AAC.25